MLHLLTLFAFANKCLPDRDAHVSDVQAGPCLEAVLADDLLTVEITSTCGPGTLNSTSSGGPTVYLQESATLAYDLSSLREGSEIDVYYAFVPDDGAEPEDLVVTVSGPVTGECPDGGCDHAPGTPSLAALALLGVLGRRRIACST